MGENDWDGWRNLTVASEQDRAGGRRYLLHQSADPPAGNRQGIGNAILIKLNQIGTVTETLDTMELAARNAYRCLSPTGRAKPRTPSSRI